MGTDREIVKAINSDSVASEDLVSRDACVRICKVRGRNLTSRQSTKKPGRRSALAAETSCSGATHAASEAAEAAQSRDEPR